MGLIAHVGRGRVEAEAEVRIFLLFPAFGFGKPFLSAVPAQDVLLLLHTRKDECIHVLPG